MKNASGTSSPVHRWRSGTGSAIRSSAKRRTNAAWSSGRAARAITSSPSGVVFFHALLILFAADAERRLRACFEALDRDLLAALLADAERSIFDLGEGLLDLVEEDLLAT